MEIDEPLALHHEHVRIFVAGDRSKVSKSSVCMGLIRALVRDLGYVPSSLAYIKPATQCEATQLVALYWNFENANARRANNSSNNNSNSNHVGFGFVPEVPIISPSREEGTALELESAKKFVENGRVEWHGVFQQQQARCLQAENSTTNHPRAIQRRNNNNHNNYRHDNDDRNDNENKTTQDQRWPTYRVDEE
eukprot:CAMPEP_0168179956 /NCGR_PEP_ID=MMETSP0139_2-20121125/10189_1 /TAXON_ID=44445 /ORGANISM="Pseudo-nitzschia australis, Strain 10249 10 AB" /LENGTH=192 /DNA_ID=CAMNT_0008099959 /DNA_START=144 /DNA_END=720 /DNA_ORIENTATION=+